MTEAESAETVVVEQSPTTIENFIHSAVFSVEINPQSLQR